MQDLGFKVKKVVFSQCYGIQGWVGVISKL